MVTVHVKKGWVMGTIQDPAVFLAAQRISLAQFIVCQVHGVPVEEMRKPTRGRPHVARARQIAIHLARLVFAMTHRQLAQEFGRDRSTIHHACGLIEEMREDSAEFDSTLRWMESLLRRAAGQKDQP
jgi:chromosomal replication initiation ATPase DnaA